MKRYNPKDIEPKWQKIWEKNQQFKADNNSEKPKKYIIDMFPYPSGAAMHVGHVRNFTISDVLSQYHRQKGYEVLHTMGWDTFGLPAENYAIKTGVAPAVSTKQNIDMFKSQLQRLGMSYDWEREINTTHPEYYKWTQWIFIQLFKNNLAYQAESSQWWCPKCQTVLANEQVIEGCCWRHEDTLVIKKNLKQWFFKITEYAERLLNGIDELKWPEKIKTMQKNWIGRSEGIVYKNNVRDTDLEIESFSAHFEAFTANTFVIIAPDHPLLPKLVQGLSNADEILKQAHEMLVKRDAMGQKGTETLEGIFTGRYAIDKFGDEDLPIWIASYALADYGTGIVLCSAHDDRDFAFAKKYGIRLKPTMVPPDPVEEEKVKALEYCYTDMMHGILIEPEDFKGKNAHQNRQQIANYMISRDIAAPKVSYKIHDWLISRQRYWGVPIPIIHCSKDGAVPVPETELPVVLPEVENYQPTGGNASVLASVDSWVNTTCPTCGGPAKRETDTMDGYACSSWYFLRYTDARNTAQAWDPAIANKWLPIDFYCGGDHAVSHLLYARFWMYFFADQGWIKNQEPVDRLVYNGYILAPDGNKMSKSKGNVINPNELIDQGYGADSLRVFEMFIAPYEQNTNWNTHGVPGTYRFLNRLWTLVHEYIDTTEKDTNETNKEILQVTHKTIKKVTNDLDNLQFNTSIAALMQAVNDLFKIKAEDRYKASEWKNSLSILTQLVAPFAPHIAEELWQDLGHTESVHISPWPEHDERYLLTEKINIVVQVNGKVRANIQVPAEADENTIIETAKNDENVSNYLTGGIKKTVYISKKLVNFVV